MASVSSLDKDLSRLRRAKYTPQQAEEIKTWIQEILHEPLGSGDLMDILKDGSLLCRLANEVSPSSGKIRFKSSAMPFVQMENISHFLDFVSRPPVSLPPHDRFLTVDLYEKKDPAQVVQCISAFSRLAHKINPGAFPTTVGGLKGGALSPQLSGVSNGGSGFGERKVSGNSINGGKPTVPPRKAMTTAWTRPEHEGVTSPAWNIAQYGYIGGANQGNNGISFGARRQITQTPVSSMRNLSISPDREKQRQQDALEAVRKREAEAAEAAAREREMEEQRRQQAEEEERAALEAEQIRWKEEEEKRRQWQVEQDRQREIERLRDERDAEEARKLRDSEQQRKLENDKQERERERLRIRELERELERARERERLYEAEKEERRRAEMGQLRNDVKEVMKQRTGERSPVRSPLSTSSIVQSEEEERKYLQQAWKRESQQAPAVASKPLNMQKTPAPKPPPRALPTPPRKLPPTPVNIAKNGGSELKRVESWESGDDQRPLDSPTKEKKESELQWASMSFLERERERERQRQKEWEQSQMETKKIAEHGVPEDQGPAWSVNEYGYADDILDLY